MYTTQIKLTFTVFGDVFNPVEFTDILDIPFSYMWLKGDEIKIIDGLEKRNSIRRRKESAWTYALDYSTTLNFDDLSAQFEEVFSGREDTIRSFISSNNLDAIVNVVVEIANSQVPSLTLSKSFINILSKIGSEIDFDIYVLDQD